jgi:hypothetical protein
MAAPEIKLVKWNAVAVWCMSTEQRTCPICKFVFSSRQREAYRSVPELRDGPRFRGLPRRDRPPAFSPQGVCTHSFHKHCIDRWIQLPASNQMCAECVSKRWRVRP